MNFKVYGPYFEKSGLCEPILGCLPEWFGVEEATANYVRKINELPTLLACDDEQV